MGTIIKHDRDHKPTRIQRNVTGDFCFFLAYVSNRSHRKYSLNLEYYSIHLKNIYNHSLSLSIPVVPHEAVAEVSK